MKLSYSLQSHRYPTNMISPKHTTATDKAFNAFGARLWSSLEQYLKDLKSSNRFEEDTALFVLNN